MKSSICTVMLTLSFALSAAILPEDHFLFPRDKEVMWISGIEDAVSQSELRSLIKNCKVVREFDSCQWINEFRQSEIYDFTQFKFDAQIVLLGERHIDLTHQAALQHIIVNNDFDVLALEMFNFVDQKSIDAYLADEISLNELEKVLNAGWNYESSGYIKAIESAKLEGMKILAIDNRPLFESESFSNNLFKRDQFMADVINQYLLVNPKSKILIYSGKMHAFKSHSQEQRLKSLNEMIHSSDKKSYFLFGPKEKNLMTSSQKLILTSEQSIIIHNQAFLQYIDGAIFLK